MQALSNNPINSMQVVHVQGATVPKKSILKVSLPPNFESTNGKDENFESIKKKYFNGKTVRFLSPELSPTPVKYGIDDCPKDLFNLESVNSEITERDVVKVFSKLVKKKLSKSMFLACVDEVLEHTLKLVLKKKVDKIFDNLISRLKVNEEQSLGDCESYMKTVRSLFFVNLIDYTISSTAIGSADKKVSKNDRYEEPLFTGGELQALSEATRSALKSSVFKEKFKIYWETQVACFYKILD
jgi:hypothetical protein